MSEKTPLSCPFNLLSLFLPILSPASSTSSFSPVHFFKRKYPSQHPPSMSPFSFWSYRQVCLINTVTIHIVLVQSSSQQSTKKALFSGRFPGQPILFLRVIRLPFHVLVAKKNTHHPPPSRCARQYQSTSRTIPNQPTSSFIFLLFFRLIIFYLISLPLTSSTSPLLLLVLCCPDTSLLLSFSLTLSFSFCL